MTADTINPNAFPAINPRKNGRNFRYIVTPPTRSTIDFTLHTMKIDVISWRMLVVVIIKPTG
jgi:hypothetical protein